MNNLYAVVENGVVTNIVVWDGVSNWKPDQGDAIAIPDGVVVTIGDTYDGAEFHST